MSNGKYLIMKSRIVIRNWDQENGVEKGARGVWDEGRMFIVIFCHDLNDKETRRLGDKGNFEFRITFGGPISYNGGNRRDARPRVSTIYGTHFDLLWLRLATITHCDMDGNFELKQKDIFRAMQSLIHSQQIVQFAAGSLHHFLQLLPVSGIR